MLGCANLGNVFIKEGTCPKGHNLCNEITLCIGGKGYCKCLRNNA